MVDRMLKGKRLRMQRNPAAAKIVRLRAKLNFRSIQCITNDRVVSRTGLQTNLMSPPGMKLDFQQSHPLAINFETLFDHKSNTACLAFS